VGTLEAIGPLGQRLPPLTGGIADSVATLGQEAVPSRGMTQPESVDAGEIEEQAFGVRRSLSPSARSSGRARGDMLGEYGNPGRCSLGPRPEDIGMACIEIRAMCTASVQA
jgi:hypothetical protein